MSITKKHPILSDELISELHIQDQVFSVEASLDSLIPWIKDITQIENKKILVFGTGGGGTAIALAINIGNGIVYGVDISDWAINTTQKRAVAYSISQKIKLFQLHQAFPLPFEDEYFDLVILADVIEHIVDERSKYVKDNFRKLKKGGLFVITGTPNILYPYDWHTTKLLFVPWMPSEIAYKYAIWRGKWEEGKNLDFAGRKGVSYWQIKKWLKHEKYEVLNLRKNFTSDYLKTHKRLNSVKRKLLFKPYSIVENICRLMSFPVTAIMPYINHLFIIKK